jgi:hypothetical protein
MESQWCIFYGDRDPETGLFRTYASPLDPFFAPGFNVQVVCYMTTRGKAKRLMGQPTYAWYPVTGTWSQHDLFGATLYFAHTLGPKQLILGGEISEDAWDEVKVQSAKWMAVQ